MLDFLKGMLAFTALTDPDPDPNPDPNADPGGDKPLQPWMAQTKGDLQQNQELGKFKDINEMASSYLELASKATEGGIEIPGEEATDEDWAAFHKAIGRPDSADDYTYSEEGVEEAYKFPKEGIALLREVVHNAGLSGKMGEAVLTGFVKANAEGLKALDDAHAEATSSAERNLKLDWKENYDRNTALAKRAYNTFGGGPDSELSNMMRTVTLTDADGKEVLLGDSAVMRKAFYEIGRRTTEEVRPNEEPRDKTETTREQEIEETRKRGYPIYKSTKKRYPNS